MVSERLGHSTIVALHKKSESHPRQWVDGSGSSYKESALGRIPNPANGSWRIVQILPLVGLRTVVPRIELFTRRKDPGIAFSSVGWI